MRADYGPLHRSETVHLSFLACDQHAYQNEIGVRILEKTPLMSLLRLLAYVAFTFDMDVIAIRFSDEQYAREFRKANPQATSRQLTDSPPFFMRPLFWKIASLVGLLAFIALDIAACYFEASRDWGPACGPFPMMRRTKGRLRLYSDFVEA